MQPIKMTVIFTARSMLCMANISSSTYFEMVSCTRVGTLDIIVMGSDSTSKQVSLNKTAIFHFSVNDGF